VLIDANADASIVAANVWAAVRDRLFAVDAVNVVSSA
jgi:dTMP kinase